jgi:acyl-CoA thioesterase-1
LAWAVPAEADAVIVQLGANDALRGGDPARARANLDQIVGTLVSQRKSVLLAGMLAPRNMPADYRAAFDSIYPDLATKHGALLYPFFLDGVALDPKLNISDGIHPTAEGVGMIVSRILPQVEALIARVKDTRG